MTSDEAQRCKGCASSLAPGVRFCPQCGRAVAHEAREGERRQMTVLFCDLMDSTQLAHGLDPEDFHDVIGLYQQAVARIVSDLDGHVGQYLGDGVLVYFGYPTAHEDDALRAVNAAVRIRESLPGLGDEVLARVPDISGHTLQMRFGVYTGPVVVSATAAGQEPQALGDTVNLASRLQTSAGPNEILISDTTHRLAGSAFVTEVVELDSLKGIAETVTAWKVIEPSHGLGAAGSPLVSPLVGRAAELAGLAARWERARRGQGQALLVVGEPGVGKSRLLSALRERIAIDAARSTECHASALHQNSALHPIIALLEHTFDLRREQTAEARIQRIERLLEERSLPRESSMPVLANLLSLPLPAAYASAPVSPEELRRQTLVWLSDWLTLVDGKSPVLLAIEDLHWIDDSTQELLGVLIDRIRDKPVLLVMTARTSFEPPWPGLEKVVISPLRRHQTEDLIRQVAAGRELPADVIDEIAARTDGVPLFVEELTRSVLEDATGGRKAPSQSIPFTIQDLLTARIDRLGAAKPLAQVASVLGRVFPRSLLEEVSLLPAAEVDAGLRTIVEAGLIHCEDASRGSYAFHHALVRDVAYQSLLRGARREVHVRAAHALATLGPGSSEAAPELIAQHCEEGGLFERAVFHYSIAARTAVQKSANVEAIAHFRRALALIERVPSGREREQREFELQMGLGPALIAIGGYGDPAAERAFARAQLLSKGLDDGPHRLYALYGLSTYYQARADLTASIELAGECLSLAERIGDPCALMLGHLRLGLSLYYAGDHARALEHHRQAAALYRHDEHGHMAFVHGQDPGALAAMYAALAEWALGHPDRARASGQTALRLAEQSGHPHTRAFIAAFSAVLCQMLREPERTEALATESIALAEKHGFALWVGFSGVLQGWARAVRGTGAREALETIRTSLDRLTRIGTIIGQAYFLGLLADAQAAVGDDEGALDSVDAALAFTKDKRISYWQPELLRLRAGLMLSCDTAEAMAGFERALELARRQGARSHELRIVTSAGELLHRLGRDAEARELVDPLCRSLAAEGDTRDLAEARSLLGSLA